MKHFIFLLPVLFICGIICSCEKTIPAATKKASLFTDKGNLWIFMMAGQSNMAGRGKVEAQDMITNRRILTVDKENNWILAKEPIHFYESPGGLDCGLSFAKYLLKYLPDSISIAMIPCAVGGSSVTEWLGDSIHRDVRLLSNFNKKVDISKKKGVIKGIIWHQGERNANQEDIPVYKASLVALFAKFRQNIGNEELPIIMGELGKFAEPPEKQIYFNQINNIIHLVGQKDPNCYWISSEGLTDKGDHLHFDSDSQRELGRRYANKFLDLIQE